VNLSHFELTPARLRGSPADSPNDMSAANRSAGRDVHIYDAKDPNTALGGLVLTNGITNVNLYSMVEIFCIFDSNYLLRDEGGMTI
jgi:hypothetical protein